ncbi:MAG: AAA family ATPase [Candidatus Binataceae bacterium]
MPKTELANSSGPTNPSVVGRAGAFIGRRPELDEMRSALREAVAGSGRLVLLSGEPGVGKTRLAEELAREAQARGTHVALGRCWEGGGAPAYWPWVQIIREAARSLSPAGLVEIRAATGYIAQMIPELRPALPAIDSATETHGMPSLPASVDRPEQARFQLFDSISVLLRSAATVKPLLLIVDDLHAADADSLLLLKFLARDLPQSRILVIGTYREIEVRRSVQQAELLGELIREASCFPLRGLCREEIAEFIENYLGRAIDQTLLESLVRTTEGNPFFLDEIIRLMKVEGKLLSTSPQEPRFTIPDGIRSAVRRRLAPLSDNARLALAVASVIGHEFEFALLQRISKLAAAQLTESLDQAIELGLVIEASAARYRFSHAIIPEVLRAEISRPRLIQLHQRAAEAIEELHRGDLDAHAAAIALHYEQTLLPDDRTARPTLLARRRRKIADYARRGAERSLKQLAYGEAARLYQMALDALADANARPQQGEVLLGLGEALRKAEDWPEAKQVFARATDLARELGNTDLLARAALASGSWSTTLFGANVDAEVVGLLQGAMAAVGHRDSGIRAALLARLAQELAASEGRERSLTLCEEAIEVARRVDDAGAMVSALWTQHQLLWGPHDVEKRLDAASEIVRLAEKAGALDWALSAREFRLSALVELGRIDLADREIETYTALQERTGQSFGTIERYRAMRCLMRGDFQRAEQYARDLIKIAQRRQDQPLLTAFGTLMIQIRAEQGQADKNENPIHDYAVQFPTLAIARCGLADVYAGEGREAEARQEFERFAADDFVGISLDCNWIISLTTLCGVCIFLHDERRAETLYELLRPYSRRNVTIGWADVSYGSLERHLGRLAALMKRFDQAKTHFLAALRFDQQMEAPPFVAHTRYEYGSMLLRRGREGDREEALSLLGLALDSASTLGMKDLEMRVQGLIATTVGPDVAAAPASVERVNASAPPPPGRAIASVLFTDVVGSTERLTELKDRRWAELLARLHQALRKEVVDFGGREINTAGDGMLSIFNDPAAAIRCAFAIAASAQRLGLQVRAGIHTGECEFLGDNVAGIAVHIGARVAARAGAGEVMVSSTVRDLLAGGEIVFGDRGATALKGVPGEWHLYSVEPPG